VHGGSARRLCLGLEIAKRARQPYRFLNILRKWIPYFDYNLDRDVSVSSIEESSHESMDPFTALSVATSVLQIIDFGSKLLSVSYEIHQRGSLVGNDDVKFLAEDLRELNNTLLNSLKFTSTPSSFSGDETVRRSPLTKFIAIMTYISS